MSPQLILVSQRPAQVVMVQRQKKNHLLWLKAAENQKCQVIQGSCDRNLGGVMFNPQCWCQMLNFFALYNNLGKQVMCQGISIPQMTIIRSVSARKFYLRVKVAPENHF